MAWYEEDVGRGWRVAYRLVPQGDAIVIGEVRILPAELDGRRTPGEWSGEHDRVPVGGVTDAVTKALRTEIPVDRARGVFAWLTLNMDLERMGSLDFIRPLHEARDGERRRFRDDRPLGEVAAAYVRHCGEKHPAPVRAAAEDFRYSRKYTGKLLAKARERGLLTPTTPGKAGGELTARCRRILGSSACA